MAQAGAINDLTQRLFVELKSKNEEARARAAYELYDNVLSVSRGGIAHSRSTQESQLTFLHVKIGLMRSSSSFIMQSANASPNSS